MATDSFMKMTDTLGRGRLSSQYCWPPCNN